MLFRCNGIGVRHLNDLQVVDIHLEASQSTFILSDGTGHDEGGFLS